MSEDREHPPRRQWPGEPEAKPEAAPEKPKRREWPSVLPPPEPKPRADGLRSDWRQAQYVVGWMVLICTGGCVVTWFANVLFFLNGLLSLALGLTLIWLSKRPSTAADRGVPERHFWRLTIYIVLLGVLSLPVLFSGALLIFGLILSTHGG